MDTGKLKVFAQAARRQLLEDVGTRLEQVLRADSVETREKKAAITELRQQINQANKRAVIDRVAYTWFNRFCALRFMDVNHYTRLGIVSPVEGYSQPEILQEAKQGVIDTEFDVDRPRVLDILSNKMPSSDPQGEAYRLLLVGACNAYHQMMPFLFEPIADYTELLMPDDLLSENSVLHKLRKTLTEEICQDVEVIGWLYQFYISEKKAEVDAKIKIGGKVNAEEIPPKTALFTPHWIVCYLVDNSLGRLWMFNNPDSKLINQMEYYIKPEQAEADFLRIASAEEIKVCDPACGSGHMLTYAFDLFYTIYEELGYDPTQIPSLILQKNLFGIEIDKRAGDLAALALVMKARAKDRRFFSRKVEPNICVLQNVSFSDSEIDEYMNVVGRDLFTQDLGVMLKQFEQADNFGSLIQPQIKDVVSLRSQLSEKKVFENLFLDNISQRVQQVLKQAEYLSPRYHVVVANPPYLGKGMNDKLTKFANNCYSDSKSDLFSMFIMRGFKLILTKGYNALVTMHSWMFIPSHEKMRKKLLKEVKIECMVHMASMVMGIAFGTAATVWQKNSKPNAKGYFSYVEYDDIDKDNKPVEFPINYDRLSTASSSDFKKIPDSPISYWASDRVRELFNEGDYLGKVAEPKQGLITGNNDHFLRYWHEVNFRKIGFGISTREKARESSYHWFPFAKGGEYRKLYGNHFFVVNWKNDGEEIKNYFDNQGKLRSRPQNMNYYFKEAVTWSKYSGSNYFGVRYLPTGFIFSDAGSSVFPKYDLFIILGYLVSKVSSHLLTIKNPTLTFQIGDLKVLPFNKKRLANFKEIGKQNMSQWIQIYKEDWDSFETSWDFSKPKLLNFISIRQNINQVYNANRTDSQSTIAKAKQLEENNNSLFIEAYGLQDELTPDVPLEGVTLTCNPYYRYGGKKNEKELENLLVADTMKEFISYAVGCMFGRYSLDKPGLILANQGETAEDYYRQVPQSSFLPDEDNVLPVLEAGWFSDDITERFKKFLHVTFGDEHYEENLAFIENSIGREIRSYFLKDFYGEHLRMYKNRPIYWLFSSPNGSFNALVYMHRYRPDTISVILNDYLREYVRKLNAHKAHLGQVSLRLGGSQAEKTKATKEIDALNKVLAELKEYEDEVLYPLATRQIQIDLDDGVKVNYNKFGKALKSVKGLNE